MQYALDFIFILDKIILSNTEYALIFVFDIPILIDTHAFRCLCILPRSHVRRFFIRLLDCTARQCSPLRGKFMECSIINPALSLLTKHLVIGQRQKAPNFSAFHWSPHGRLVSIGQHFVTRRVVYLPKRTETSLPKRS